MDAKVACDPRRRRWESTAHLGNTVDGRGEQFRILLVDADPTLVETFQHYLRTERVTGNQGMTVPVLPDLPIAAEIRVRRKW